MDGRVDSGRPEVIAGLGLTQEILADLVDASVTPGVQSRRRFLRHLP